MTSEELKIKLEESLKEERLEALNKELKVLQQDYENKCFGTDSFTRNSSASRRCAVFYEKFFIKKNEIYVLEHEISLLHFNNFHKKDLKQVSYHTNIGERQLSGLNKYHSWYNLNTSRFSKEISLEKFKELWNVGEEINLTIKNIFSDKFSYLQEEWMTNAESSEEQTIEEFIKNIGIKLIDLKDYPETYNVLKYRSLPLFDKQRWLPEQYAKAIIEYQIIKLKNELTSPFMTDRSLHYIQNEINVLTQFIKDLKL